MSGRGVIAGGGPVIGREDIDGAGGGGGANDAGRGAAKDGFGAAGANDGFGACGANDGCGGGPVLVCGRGGGADVWLPNGAGSCAGGGVCIFGGRGSGMSEPGGIADVDTRSGGDAGSVVTSGLRSSGAAIGSVPPGRDSDAYGICGRDDCDGSGIGGRDVSPDGASGMRLVCGPGPLDGGGLMAIVDSKFAGGAMPIDVCCLARGRVPDVERFDAAPDTDCATGCDAGAGGATESGRGACGAIEERVGGRVTLAWGTCADGFVPPPLGGPGRGGETEVDPAGLVVRAPLSLPATFAGEGCRPSRSAKTALIRKMK